MLTMSKPKRKTTSGPHKPRVMVGIPTRIAAALRDEAKQDGMPTLAELVRHISVEFLKGRGKWPLKEKPAP